MESEEESTVTTETKTEQDLAMELYNAFLTGNVKATGWDINEMTIPTGEPDNGDLLEPGFKSNYVYFAATMDAAVWGRSWQQERSRGEFDGVEPVPKIR